MLIALTLGLQLQTRAELLPFLVPVSVIQSTAIVVRHRAAIDLRLLFRVILPLMVVGVAGGVALTSYVEGPLLKRAFGVMVMAFAARELWRLKPRAVEVEQTPLARPAAGLGILVGRLGLPKGAFRATLTCVFLILNVGLTGWFASQGQITQTELTRLAATLPVLVACLFVGEWIHDRVSETRFKVGVYALLLLAGATLLT
jgi:uncharacterized membrane protein YfcA